MIGLYHLIVSILELNSKQGLQVCVNIVGITGRQGQRIAAVESLREWSIAFSCRFERNGCRLLSFRVFGENNLQRNAGFDKRGLDILGTYVDTKNCRSSSGGRSWEAEEEE